MSKRVVCPQCGHRGEPRRITKGSLAIEVIAWLAFLVPGIIYSVWRLTSRYDGCSACGAAGVIPEHSPRGAEIVRRYHDANFPGNPDDDLPKGNARRGYAYMIAMAIGIVTVIVLSLN